jgi:glycosyltransferase involved in cell wall biosynthesis
MIKLSILIPVYNVEKYIRRCLDSVYKQITDNCEVIMVDDGSTDGSGLICDEYFNKYSQYTKITHKKNEGAYPTRNIAMDSAQGEYLWFIDPDDYIEDDIIQKIYKLVCDRPDVISFAYKRFTDDMYSSTINGFKTCLISGESYLLKYFPDSYLWSKVYRRDFLVNNGIRFNDKLNTQGDGLFNMYVFLKCKNLLLTDIYAYNYFKGNPTSTLSNKDVHHRIRGVNNSIIVIFEMKRVVENYDGKKIYIPLCNWLNLKISGFFYSLLRINYPINDILYIINDFKQKGLYPIGPTRNKKAMRFNYVANHKFLFVILCFLHRVFFPK